jgi:hypothetical protein
MAFSDKQDGKRWREVADSKARPLVALGRLEAFSVALSRVDILTLTQNTVQ